MGRDGWTKWKPPLAPLGDGTRKVVWQLGCRERIYDIHALVFWGIKARMLEATEAACSAVRAEGKTPSAKCGLRTKRMAAWRAMGRTLLDIGMLVFNVGRCDFRNKHTVSYALMVQSSCHVGVADYAAFAKTTCDNMFLSIGVLIELIGIIRMTDQILQPTPLQPLKQLASGIDASTKLTKTTIRLTLQTLLNHRCWRDYRKLVTYLPEIHLGGTFQGIWLQCSDFDAPGASRPVAAPSTKREGIVERRRTRFAVTLAALERLLKWTRLEHAAFAERFLGVATRIKPGLPTANAKKEQVHVDDNIEK